MSAPAAVTVRGVSRGSPTSNEEVDTLRTQLNLLTTAFRALCAKLDADGGVTDTNYVSTVSDAASAIINTVYG